MTDFLKTLIL